jgi:hypothetical protein
MSIAKRLERIEHGISSLGGSAELQAEISALRGQLALQAAERFDLHCELAASADARRSLAQALAEERRRNADVASLYVATQRLHSTLDRGEVLHAIEEIVASLIGCEELAVFELIGKPPALAPVAVVGLAPGHVGLVQPGQGVVGCCVSSGETWVAAETPAEGGITACVPLKVDGLVTGAIALYRLLAHKPRLVAADIELLELLGVHAGTALFASRLRGRLGTEAS